MRRKPNVPSTRRHTGALSAHKQKVKKVESEKRVRFEDVISEDADSAAERSMILPAAFSVLLGTSAQNLTAQFFAAIYKNGPA